MRTTVPIPRLQTELSGAMSGLRARGQPPASIMSSTVVREKAAGGAELAHLPSRVPSQKFPLCLSSVLRSGEERRGEERRAEQRRGEEAAPADD